MIQLFVYVSCLCHKHKGQFLLKPDVPLPHLVFCFLQWTDRKLSGALYGVLLNVIQGESRQYLWCWTFICPCSFSLWFAWHPFYCPPLWHWNQLVFSWLGFSAGGGMFYGCNCRAQTLVHTTFLEGSEWSNQTTQLVLAGSLEEQVCSILGVDHTHTNPFTKHSQISYVGNL